MNQEQFLKNLSVPTGKIDVVLDTDTYNEADDQVAIAYMLKSEDKINVKGICAAPYYGNGKSDSPADGMEKSYNEIFNILHLAGRFDLDNIVYSGSKEYMENESTPVESPAAQFIADLANNYTPESPLYIVAIGAITNVASALLLNPAVKENAVVVWLGGHAHHMPDTAEFNMRQDVAAARIVFGCGVPVVQLPCLGVVSAFTTSQYELEHWLGGKNELCDYLIKRIIWKAETYAKGKPWARPIWDVTAIAWLLNDKNRFMIGELKHAPIPQYDHHYSFDCRRHFINYIYQINRDNLFADLFEKLGRN